MTNKTTVLTVDVKVSDFEEVKNGIKDLQEENKRLKLENEQLKAVKDIYYRAMMFAHEKVMELERGESNILNGEE